MPSAFDPAKPLSNTPTGYPRIMASMTRPLAPLVALTAAPFLSSCSTSASDSHADHPQTVITGQPAGYNVDDVAFATNMIPHHQQAVNLSAMVPNRSTNAGLVGLANQISAAQQPEINIMKVFLVQWNENPDTNSGHAGHGSTTQGMVDAGTMTKLESMISHHQGAIEMAKAEVANGDNVDAKTVANNIVTTQEAEIGQMKQMLGG